MAALIWCFLLPCPCTCDLPPLDRLLEPRHLDQEPLLAAGRRLMPLHHTWANPCPRGKAAAPLAASYGGFQPFCPYAKKGSELALDYGTFFEKSAVV